MFKLFESFINKSSFVLFFVACVLFVGLFSFNNIGKSSDSYYNYNHLRIITNYGGASLEKVDLEVTTKLEEELQKIEYIGNISSMSRIGQSIIDVELKVRDKKYISFILSDLRARLHSIYNENLPKSASLPILDESINHVYNMVYVFKGKDYNTVYSYLKTKILPVIAGIQGIERHKVWGGKQEVLYIVTSKSKLNDYGISPEDLKKALSQNHLSFSKEELILKNGQISIVADSVVSAKEEISNITISTSTGEYRLADIAKIESGFQVSKNTEFLYNNQSALALGIALGSDVDAIKLEKILDRKIASSFQRDIELEKMNLTSDNLLKSYGQYFAVFFVFIVFISVLTFFLFAKKGLFTFLLSSVFTVSAMFIGMNILSIGLNNTTILAILVVFFTFVAMLLLFLNKIKFGNGRTTESFLENDAVDDFFASFRSSFKYTLYVEMVIFLLGIFLRIKSSLFGSILYDFGSVLIIGAIVNFFALALIAPSICKMFYSQHQAKHFVPHRTFRILLRFFLRLRYLVFILIVLIIFILPTLFVSSKISVTPLVKHSKYVKVDLTLPLGTKIEKTTSVVEMINSGLQGYRDVTKSFVWIGDFTPRISQSASIYNPDSSRVFMVFELDNPSMVDNFISAFDKYISNSFPDVKFTIAKLSSFVDFDNTISARIIGEEPTVLRKYAEQVSYNLYNMKGLNNIRTSWRGKVRVILPLYNSRKAETYDISKQDLIDVLEYYYNGYNIGYYYDKNSTSVPVMLRPENAGFKTSKVGTRQVYSKKIKDFVSISEIVNALEYKLLNGQTTKYNRQTNIDIMADNSLDNTIYYMLNVNKVINSVSLPRGYLINLNGSFENYVTMLKEGFKYFALLTILLLLVLLAVFNKFVYVFSFIIIMPTVAVLDLFLLKVFGFSVNIMTILSFLISVVLFFIFAVYVIENVEKYVAKGKNPEEAMLFGIGENVKLILGFALSIFSVFILFTNDFSAGFVGIFAINTLYFAAATLLILPQITLFFIKRKMFGLVFKRRK